MDSVEIQDVRRSRTESVAIRQERIDTASKDSPIFRNQLESLESQLEGVQASLAAILKSARTLLVTEKATSQPFHQLSVDLRSFTTFSSSRRTIVVDALASFADTFDNIAEMRKTEAIQLEATLIAPLQEFLDSEFRTVKDLRKKVVVTRKEHESSLNRFAQHATATDAQRRYVESRRNFELANLAYVSKLNELEAKKTTQFVDRLNSFAQTQALYFRQGNTLFEALQPLMCELNKHVGEARGQLDTLFKLTNAKRDELMSESETPTLSRMTSDMAKEGYLWKKARGISGEWQRRWFVVRGGLLYYLTQDKTPAPKGLISLLLASVKHYAGDDRRKYCFEIVLRQQQGDDESRNYILQTDSEQDRSQWIQVITNNIATLLDASSTAAAPSSPTLKVLRSKPTRTLKAGAFASTCVDCGARDPEWASLNLGVSMCIECSGTHRQVGTHISKVRSLTLDTWDCDVVALMEAVGNEKANSVWERNTMDAIRPTPDASREQKAKWVTDKYVQKLFVEPWPGTADTLGKELLAAVQRGELLRVYAAFVRGAVPNEIRAADGRAPLHLACARGDVKCALLLILNGANVDCLDNDKKWTPLFYAAQGNHRDTCEMLLVQHASTDITDSSGRTAEELAAACSATECQMYLLDIRTALPAGSRLSMSSLPPLSGLDMTTLPKRPHSVSGMPPLRRLSSGPL
eukprot:TRINITY_DN13075_c0_g1_i1.p1 TRINITY_DN13075_c0_g1~~TRINITY_DN13075_c0_g1_i1.p1  ORF type:complete len:692 (+),score=137.59 TRINITY_DN13075_c0_g1_i1:95-2170(+)